MIDKPSLCYINPKLRRRAPRKTLTANRSSRLLSSLAATGISDDGIAVFVKRVLSLPSPLEALPPLLLNGVEMASDILVHPEHVDFGLLEHSLHLLVAADLALVCGVLEIVGLDVLPQLLDDLRTGQLLS